MLACFVTTATAARADGTQDGTAKLATAQAAPAQGIPAEGAPPPFQGRLFWGGMVGLGFGDVEYLELSPMLGYRFTPRFFGGAQVTYRHSSFDYLGEDQSTNDWGGDLFASYTVWRNVFATAEYEYLRFEFYPAPGVKVEDSFSSFFVGGGYAQPMGSHASFLVSALYNLSYSDNEPGPYGSPLIFRAGIGIGF